MQTTKEALNKLKKSTFRSSFHFSEKEYTMVQQKGLSVIRSHAADFVQKRLAPAVIENDGRQTPMRGHPVFIAQHACACCCRGCLNKWYRVPLGVELLPIQQEKIVSLLMAWIEEEMIFYADKQGIPSQKKE
jgi:exodeoxyribonuclease V alpha subunit